MPRSTQLSLPDAIAEHVHDGDTVALEGFTHLIPFAAGHEIIRQGRRDLTLVRMTPDVIYDQMIGDGLRAASSSSPTAATPASARCTACATRSRTTGRAPLEIVEHSHAGLANALRRGRVAAAVRGAARLHRHGPPSTAARSRSSSARSPASSCRPSARSTPTSRVIHAQQADRAGQRHALGPVGRAEGGGARGRARRS